MIDPQKSAYGGEKTADQVIQELRALLQMQDASILSSMPPKQTKKEWRESALWEVEASLRIWLDQHPKAETMVKSGIIHALDLVNELHKREDE